MFLRPIFTRKDSNNDEDVDELEADANDSNNNSSDYKLKRHHNDFRVLGAATAPPLKASTKQHYTAAPPLQQRAATSSATGGGPSVVKLTPLWEHILRTRTLPESINPGDMFAEFVERLRDPEWQVRQHALRVLVDVLVVMRVRADTYMEALIPQLVENLGHPAPTVRKGALDCLRVYLAETAMPQTILLQILDIGLNQKITNEPFGGRLTCGVMLSLPALVQSTLHSPKRHFILRTTIDMLVERMGQVTHQEITLKVLTKIRELIGDREFIEFMSHGAFREYELLCNVYGVDVKVPGKENYLGGSNAGSTWRLMTQQAPQSCWRSSEEEEEEVLASGEKAKVIMETEIKINDDTLTMRILEAKGDDCGLVESSAQKSQDVGPNSLEDEVVCGRLLSAKGEHEACGLLQLFSDSEVEDHSNQSGEQKAEYFSVVTPSTPSRTPKRVTFGGEVVKMRTPDSDTASSNNNNNSNNSNNDNRSVNTLNQNVVVSGNSDSAVVGVISDVPSPEAESKTSILSVDIPNDNTKPLPRPKSAQSPKRELQVQPPTLQPSSPPTISASNSPKSPVKRKDSIASLSPKSPFKRLSISPVDNIISPKPPHKQIEVLHNLQRDPSPIRARSARRTSISADGAANEAAVVKLSDTQQLTEKQKSAEQPTYPKSWEELGIVDYDTVMDLRSGDWRHRLHGIAQLEAALRDSKNLALVQPCLDSLLRTLLSSERNPDVAEEKRRLLMNLISRLPLDNLEDRTLQIMTGLCRQGDAGANRVCKTLMQRLPPAVIVLKLTSGEFSHAKSSKFREHALQMVMYALTTFPSTCFDTATCVTNTTYAALSRKRRVRQAALDVLAILGQVTTPRTVMEIVQSIAATRDDGEALVAAIKMRLSRKQLPLVTAEGLVQYTLRVPSPCSVDMALSGAGPQLDADIEWIATGVGSVSPTSLKRRAYRNRSISQQSFRCLPQQGGAEGDIAYNRNNSDDIAMHRHTFRSPPELYGNAKNNGTGYQQFGISDDNHFYNIQQMLGSNMPIHYGLKTKKSNVDYSNYAGTRRLGDKSCSDSSADGRSSDSTYTSSSGNGPAVAAVGVATNDLAGISGRFTRQAGNSRFPAMDRMDLNSTYVRVHKPPTYYPGMGAYAHLQQQQYHMSSTYPKVNYTMPTTQTRRRSHQTPQQTQEQPPLHYNQSSNQSEPYLPQQLQKSNTSAQENFKQTENHGNSQLSNNANANLDSTYTVCSGMAPPSNATTKTTPANQHNPNASAGNGSKNGNSNRRFVNVDKFIMQSNKSSQTHGTILATPDTTMQPEIGSKEATPTSAKSYSYSQKSTASAESSISGGKTDGHQATLAEGKSESIETNINCSTPTTTLKVALNAGGDNALNDESPPKWSSGEEVLEIEDLVDTVTDTAILAVENSVERAYSEVSFEKTGSLISLQSKTESIHTQLDSSTPMVSRAQSLKSLMIEEDIEGNGAAEHAGAAALDKLSSKVIASDIDGGDSSNTIDSDHCYTKTSTPLSGRRSPTIAELKMLSRSNSNGKSRESLYEHSTSKQDSVDNTTETSSHSSLQFNTAFPTKAQPTPQIKKAKSTHLCRKSRRVSPVKQSIKMTPVEPFPTTLPRFEKPREALHETFEQLGSSNWEVNMLGLKSIVSLIRYHPQQLENEMHMACIQLARSVRNLRSQVARAACIAAVELFCIKSRCLEQECDDLVCALLHRTADTNRFLRADASRGLESMCDNLIPIKVLNIIVNKGAVHHNALVRTTSAKLLHHLAERLGYEKVYSMSRDNRDKFFVTAANLLLEGSLDTRKYAKAVFRVLSQHPTYERLLKEVIPMRTYRNVEKRLISIHSG